MYVVAAGHICIDITPDLQGCSRVDDLLAPGGLVAVGPAKFETGGAVANTGTALHALGFSTHLVSKAGQDAMGQMLDTLLQAHGPQLSLHIKKAQGESTSYALVVNAPGKDRCFWAHFGANESFGLDDIPWDDLPEGGIFYFGYPPLMRRVCANGGAELKAIFDAAHARGFATALDFCTPDPSTEAGRLDWRALLEKVLPSVDVFVPSLPELLFMVDRPRFESLCAQTEGPEITGHIDGALLHELGGLLVAMGSGIVGIKLGAHGFYARTASRTRLEKIPALTLNGWGGFECWVPCFDVEVRGTNGSGDRAVAGFLSAMAHGLDVLAAARTASGAGAMHVENPHAPFDWGKLQSRLAGDWAVRPCVLHLEGWSPAPGQMGCLLGPAHADNRLATVS